MTKPKVLAINLSGDEVAHCYTSLSKLYRFHFSREADEAMLVAPHFKPDIMVYEIGTPTDSALEVFAKVKDVIPEQVPVLSITSENSLEIEGAVRRTGVFYYLVKPYALQELSVLLRAALAYSTKGRP